MTSEIHLTPTGHAKDCNWHVDQYPWECTCGFIPRKKAMDDLIAQDADLIDKLRDEDSYYRLQEKHWCIDSEELERQRLAAAALIETQVAELAKYKALAETLAGALEFYADQANYKYIKAAGCCQIEAEGGDTATEALTSYKEQRDAS